MFDVVAQDKLKVCKINTHDNPADMMTKPVTVASWYRSLVQEAIRTESVFFVVSG